MTANLSYFVVLITCCCIINCDAQSKWINPHKMVDDVAKTSDTDFVADGQCTKECTDVKKRVVNCESKLLNMESEMDRKHPGMFLINQFKIFLGNISNNFCFKNLDYHEHFRVKFKFTHEECENLASFSHTPSFDQQTVKVIEHVLENFIKDFEQFSDIQFLSRFDLFVNFCYEYFSVIVTILMAAGVMVNSFWVLSRIVITKRLVFASLVILFIISVPWNWWHMYKKKEADKMATMAKAGSSDPCLEKSYWRSFMSTFSFQKDECVSHTEASHIHAAIEVTPLMAVSVTISRVILEPLEYLGASINKLIVSSIEGLPFFMQVVISILVFSLAILSLFLFFGYNLRTVFFTIGPAPYSGERKELEQVRKHNQELENKILQLKVELNERKPEKPASLSGGGDSLIASPSDFEMSPMLVDSTHNQLDSTHNQSDSSP